MISTLLLAFLVFGFLILLIYAVLKGHKLSRRSWLFSLSFILIAIIVIFFYTGSKKVQSDIARIINNSRSKSPNEIYTVLFQTPVDSCITIVNFKDQVIPKMDCCIWMEVKLCAAEINRIANSKQYVKWTYGKADSVIFLQPFSNRPKWWTPQNLGDSVTKLNITFNQDKQQSLFFGRDSTYAYICDEAL